MADKTKSDTKSAAPKTEVPPQAGASEQPPAAQASTEAPQTRSYVTDGTKILRKMSPKTIMGKIKPPFPGDAGDPNANPPVPPKAADPERELYVVMGQTNGLVTGESDFGPWVAFKGWFESARCDTGEIAQSSLCFVPEAFEELLVAAVTAQQAGDSGSMVEFAIKVAIVPSTKATSGYEYRVYNLIKVQSGDPLKALRDTLRGAGSLPALPAPKAAA